MAYFRCTTSGSGTGATITVSYESEVYGQTLTCTDGTHTYTKTAASTGSTVFTVPNGGTWTISVVMYGHTYSQQVIVVSEYTCTLALWSATVNISTTATELYSQTITVKKGGSTIGSTAFDSSGSATYIAPEEGTYTFECTYSGQTYSASVNVTEETTYSVVISMGLDLSQWLTAGGLDPSDYADLSEVLADEEAVRRLMTIHDAVDYLATAVEGDEMMETIIEDDLCAKWINLRDYAFDKLSANADIKAIMDEVDKYGYGEWVLEGQVPVMTSNTAPYGEASADSISSSTYEAWKLFDGVYGNFWLTGSSAAPHWAQYHFDEDVCVKKVYFRLTSGYGSGTFNNWTYKIQGSNDGSTWEDLTEALTAVVNNAINGITISLDNNDSYSYYRYYALDNNRGSQFQLDDLQFYAYQPKGNVPIMTSNTAPYGTASAYQVFDGNPSTTASGTDFSYKFTNPVCVKDFICKTTAWVDIEGGTLQASNDGTTWDVPTAGAFYLYYRVHFASSQTVGTVQFYGREMKVSVPPNSFSFDYSERDWDTTNPRKYIYDHGVELEEVTLAGKASKEEYDVKLIASNDQASKTLDTTDYDLLRGVVGKYASGTNVLKAGSGSATFTAANMPYNQSLDVSNINGSNAVGVKQTSTGIFTAEEWWLE